MLIKKEKKKKKYHSQPATHPQQQDAKPSANVITDKPPLSDKARLSYNYWRKRLKREKERQQQQNKGKFLTILGSLTSAVGASSKVCGAYVMSSPLLFGIGLVGAAAGLYYLIKALF